MIARADGKHSRNLWEPGEAAMSRSVPRQLLLLAVASHSVCHALEAKWTPAADGGPARFSKKYRDAQGIDDSKWGGGDSASSSSRSGGGGISIFPQSFGGWLLAIVAAWMMYKWYEPWLMEMAAAGTRVREQREARERQQQGGRVGGGQPHPNASAEAQAAREARLKKFS